MYLHLSWQTQLYLKHSVSLCSASNVLSTCLLNLLMFYHLTKFCHVLSLLSLSYSKDLLQTLVSLLQINCMEDHKWPLGMPGHKRLALYLCFFIFIYVSQWMHWGWGQMASNLQTCSKLFPWKKMVVFSFKLHLYQVVCAAMFYEQSFHLF